MILKYIYKVYIMHTQSPLSPSHLCSVDCDAIANNTKHIPKYRVQDKATLGKCTFTTTLKRFRSEWKFLPIKRGCVS